MNDLEFAKMIMHKIKILQDYIDNYGEDDINEYLEKNGTYRGIEDYLKEKKAQQNHMKKLQIAKTPITSFLHEAYACNLVLNEPNGYMWLYDTWVQWEWKSRVLDGCMPETISWKLPLTKWYAIPNALLSNSGSAFIALVRAAIDRDFYVTTCVNEKELSCVSGNLERHDILIHGYDENKNEAHIMSYDRRGLYGECVCSLDELAASYKNVNSRILWDEDTIVLVRRKEMYFYRTDLQRMRNLLEDYLCSRSCWWRFNGNSCPDIDDPTQGLNAYNQVIEYIQTLDEDNSHFDIRSFCTVRDHKYIMHERIKYLERIGYINPHAKISGKYDSIYKDAERVKLLALKYAIVRFVGSITVTNEGRGSRDPY